MQKTNDKNVSLSDECYEAFFHFKFTYKNSLFTPNPVMHTCRLKSIQNEKKYSQLKEIWSVIFKKLSDL